MTLKSKQRYFGIRADSGACRGYIYEVYGAQAQACLKELCDKDSSLPVGGWPISSPRVQEKCTCWFNNQGRASLDCTVRASAWNYKALLTWVGSFRGLCAESITTKRLRSVGWHHHVSSKTSRTTSTAKVPWTSCTLYLH